MISSGRRQVTLTYSSIPRAYRSSPAQNTQIIIRERVFVSQLAGWCLSYLLSHNSSMYVFLKHFCSRKNACFPLVVQTRLVSSSSCLEQKQPCRTIPNGTHSRVSTLTAVTSKYVNSSALERSRQNISETNGIHTHTLSV